MTLILVDLLQHVFFYNGTKYLLRFENLLEDIVLCRKATFVQLPF